MLTVPTISRLRFLCLTLSHDRDDRVDEACSACIVAYVYSHLCGQVVRTPATVTKQYNLVVATGE